MGAVGDQAPELGVCEALLPEPLGVAAFKAFAGREGAGPVLENVEKGVFRIPDKETESMRTVSVSHAVPVVADAVPGKSRYWRVQVAAVENDQHVVDEPLDVEQVVVFGIRAAIRVLSLIHI